VRDVENHGWDSGYCVWGPETAAAGRLPTLEALSGQLSAQTYVEAAERVRGLIAPAAPDLILVANYAGGFYFGKESAGMHGGLHPGDSEAVMSLGLPTGSADRVAEMRLAINAAVSARSRAEGGRRASLVDYVTAVTAALGLGL
jgi:hypothetical protein